MLQQVFKKTGSFFLCLMFLGQDIKAQDSTNDLERLEQKIEYQNSEINNLKDQINSETMNLKNEIQGYAPMFMVLFLFGSFCALWAQNTGRNPWSWFFIGMLFSILTVAFLLSINSKDLQE